jgi:hypothetical protein
LNLYAVFFSSFFGLFRRKADGLDNPAERALALAQLVETEARNLKIVYLSVWVSSRVNLKKESKSRPKAGQAFNGPASPPGPLAT